MNKPNEIPPVQCQFFVVRKKRLCRMTVRPGRQYCGEHEPQPKTDEGVIDTRIPCPNDPKHTCYASKLEKHLAICNARPTDLPEYIIPNVNIPTVSDTFARTPLSEVPRERLAQVIDKVNRLYKKYVEHEITTLEEMPIHQTVLAEFSDSCTQSSRHLRQTSSLLHVVERARLVRDRTCYVELGAGKGIVSYYLWHAWCSAETGSAALLLDRAALRHKRDNKLPARVVRLRADLAHVALHRVPVVAECQRVVGVAKHLCGVATDYALRCATSSSVLDKTQGLAMATCCHHRCEPHVYLGREQLQELGITDEEFNVILGIVSWATCGDGRPRDKRAKAETGLEDNTSEQGDSNDIQMRKQRAVTGRRAKALLDWGRAAALREKGFEVKLVIFVPESVSPENLVIVAVKP